MFVGNGHCAVPILRGTKMGNGTEAVPYIPVNNVNDVGDGVLDVPFAAMRRGFDACGIGGRVNAPPLREHLFLCVGRKMRAILESPLRDVGIWCDSPGCGGRFGGYCGTVITVPYEESG